MKQQLTIAALFITVLILPMIPVSADNPDIDYDTGDTVFSWSGTATTVELIGEWDWNEVTTLTEDSGVWSAEIDLDAGIYCYKFIIDGTYVYDPSNPYRGFCGDVENSVVRVKDSSRPNFASELSNNDLIITYLPGTSGAMPDGTPVGLESATWDSTTMTWTLDTTILEDGKHTLKLEINDLNGNQAYDHLVPFWVGEQSEFTWEDSLIYMIMTDRFINGNASNDGQPTGAAAGADWMGGDIEGVTQKIQSGYFGDLGVNVLWLTPFNTNAQGTGIAGDGVHDVSAFHGYWPIEPRQVDPRLGTSDQLKEMVDEAHTAGIRVMMDYVVNHVHQDHTYYQDNPEWFNQGCICGTTNCDWTEHRLDCQFTSYMPDVNWKVREASEQFIEDALWWLEEFDLDGARIDAVKHVDDLAATNLATRINERFETVGTDYYLKGETAMGWSGDSLEDNQFQYDTINRYIGADSLDGQADFVLYHAVVDNVFTQGTRDYQHLDYWTNRSQDQYVPGAVMVPYVGSHDVSRLASRADVGTNDAYNQWQEQGLPGQPGTDETYQAVLQAYGWLLTTPGAPLLYYGDEYGEYGGADPDNRHMYRDSNNWNHREAGLFENISALGQLRYDSIALKQGEYSTRYASPDLLIYDMTHEQQTMSIILNRGQAATYDGFDSDDLVRFGNSVISSTTTSVPANSVTVIEHDAGNRSAATC
jgi:glycosidase